MLPRVLSLAQVRQVAAGSPVPIEVFGFGSLCIMAEGRCHLSSYITGESPNLCGVCSPAKAVRWSEDAQGLSARLSEVLIDRYTPKNRPDIRPCAKAASWSVASVSMRWKNPPASTPWTCCRSWRLSASKR